MLEIGKTYKVKTLKDFKKMNVVITFYNNSYGSYSSYVKYDVNNMSENIMIRYMSPIMTALKKVTIESKKSGIYYIKEDKNFWEEWMLKNDCLIMNTE